MKLEILFLRILVVCLLATMLAGGLYFLNTIPDSMDQREATLSAVLTLGGAIFGTIFSIAKGVFSRTED